MLTIGISEAKGTGTPAHRTLTAVYALCGVLSSLAGDRVEERGHPFLGDIGEIWAGAIPAFQHKVTS